MKMQSKYALNHEAFSVILSEKTDIFKSGNHIPELGSAAMTFNSHSPLGATILVSNFTSAHTNIYSKHANWYKIFIESNF